MRSSPTWTVEGLDACNERTWGFVHKRRCAWMDASDSGETFLPPLEAAKPRRKAPGAYCAGTMALDGRGAFAVGAFLVQRAAAVRRRR